MDFINNINAMLVERFGEAGPMMALALVGLVFVAATLPMMLKRRAEPFDKLKAQRTVVADQASKGGALRAAKNSKIDKLERFANFLEPKSAEELSAARMRMLRAGYRSKNAVRIFHFSQLILGVGMLLLGVIYTLMTKGEEPMSNQQMILGTLLPGAIGYYIPKYWVNRRLQERQSTIIQGFPDALDMMLVCVEAGQSLDQSIIRVAKQSRRGYPALGEEFEIVANEVKAGKERVAVLKDMAERVGVPDVASFVTTLVQSATFGTSIAEALRVYSAEMRDKRVMRAEEKANTLPTKLTLGTMMFTVPPLLIILIGPSIYGIASDLGGH